MDANECKDFLIQYLPINYERKNSNYYQKYLLDSLVINWDKDKPQICLLVTNILFMTIIFKDFWFDDKVLSKSIKLNEQLPKSYYEQAVDFFGLSKYNEKLFLGSYLKSLDFDDNEIADIKELIDHRDHCAHACGKIYYDKQKVSYFFDLYKEAVEQIENKRKNQTIQKISIELDNRDGYVKEEVSEIIKKYYLTYCDIIDLIDVIKLLKENKTNEGNIAKQVRCIIEIYCLRIIVSSFVSDIEADKLFADEIVELSKNNLDKIDTIEQILESELSCNTDGFTATLKYELIKEQLDRLIQEDNLHNDDEDYHIPLTDNLIFSNLMKMGDDKNE